jgi:hypothetical protein
VCLNVKVSGIDFRMAMRGFRLSPRCRWCLWSSGLLRSVKFLVVYWRFGMASRSDQWQAVQEERSYTAWNWEVSALPAETCRHNIRHLSDITWYCTYKYNRCVSGIWIESDGCLKTLVTTFESSLTVNLTEKEGKILSCVIQPDLPTYLPTYLSN